MPRDYPHIASAVKILVLSVGVPGAVLVKFGIITDLDKDTVRLTVSRPIPGIRELATTSRWLNGIRYGAE
jgi:hypothetical protein